MTSASTSPTAGWTSRDTRTTRRVEVRGFGGAENLHVDHGDPTKELGPGQARVRVLASSLTLSDSIVRRGLNPYTSALAHPFTLGYAYVGVVDEVHEPVSGIAVGDLAADLTRWGANTDEVVTPATSLTRIDTDVDPVLLEPLVMNGITAYQALNVARVSAGQTVLVHGATGGVGLLLTELAAHRGATVLGTGSQSKHHALRDKGATALDGRASDLYDQVRALAPGGVDAVFDGVGGLSRATMARSLRAGGTFVGFGFAGPAGQVTELTPEILGRTAQIMAEGRAVLHEVTQAGSTAVEYEVGTARDQDRSGYDADLNILGELVAAGRLHPLVRPVGFDGVVAAHTDIDAGAVTGRLVLDHRSA